jgi:hypothetical protein
MALVSADSFREVKVIPLDSFRNATAPSRISLWASLDRVAHNSTEKPKAVSGGKLKQKTIMKKLKLTTALIFCFYFINFSFCLLCSRWFRTTSRRLGEVAFRKTVQRDDFDFLELSAETSAISPNR